MSNEDMYDDKKNEENRRKITVTHNENFKENERILSDKELIARVRKQMKEEKEEENKDKTGIKTILEANPKENYEKYFAEGGPFDRFANGNISRDDFKKAKQSVEDERKRKQLERLRQYKIRRKTAAKRIISGVVSLAAGISFIGYSIDRNHKEENARMAIQSENYMDSLENEVEDNVITMEDYTKFEKFYENLKIVRSAEDKNASNVVEAKLKIGKYVDNEHLLKMTKTFVGKKMRDALYYGDYDDSAKNDLKNQSVIKVTTREGDRGDVAADNELIIHYGTSKRLVFNNKSFTDLFARSRTIESKELGKLSNDLYELTVYNIEHKFEQKGIFQSDLDKSVELAGEIFDDIVKIQDKFFLLDKNANVEEVTREKFEEKVLEIDGKSVVDELYEKREKNSKEKDEDNER